MPKVSAHDAALALLATALIFIVLFWRLGTPTFWDPDEAHYAETSREMIATSDWSAPFYNEEPFFDKPVLFHQLQGTAMRLTGDPEFGARLVPALAALGLLGITVWFGTVMLSREVGIVAGLMLAACPGVFGLAVMPSSTPCSRCSCSAAPPVSRSPPCGSTEAAVAGLPGDRARRPDQGPIALCSAAWRWCC
jgi:hypothetical protein